MALRCWWFFFGLGSRIVVVDFVVVIVDHRSHESEYGTIEIPGRRADPILKFTHQFRFTFVYRHDTTIMMQRDEIRFHVR